jgi:single-stranded-DNA-specific exonuclease
MKEITLATTPKELLEYFLSLRNIKPADFKAFLKPPLPELNVNLIPAVKLINSCQSSKILIYGDYDVDGITSTSLLYQAIKTINPQVSVFLPHREIDGYGFKASSFLKLKQSFDLLITVDNGIVAGGEFKKIKKIFPDIKILVVDHHLASEKLPDVDVVLHSTITSAAGLAYFLAKVIYSKTDLGLAALGVVADCLPLVGVNRSLVVHGLKSIQTSPSPPLNLLLKSSGVDPKNLSVYDLSFIIAPRLNAAGRLDDPTIAFNLLNSTSVPDINQNLSILNNHNQNRQDLEKDSLIIAEKQIDKNNFIFISDKSFHPGIIGLLAGRLTEKYHLPSIIISTGVDVAKGSCRSVGGVNIIEVLRQFSDLFVDLGGHSLAAGFSILPKNIEKLNKKLIKYFKNIKIDATTTHQAEAEIEVDAITLTNIKYLKLLEPFGIGNPTPLFLLKNQIIKSVRQVGQTGDHLQLKFDNLSAIAFRQGELFKKLAVGQSIDLIASLDLNVWNGTVSPQLIVKEIIL